MSPDANRQAAYGSNIAQAAEGSTAVVVSYQYIPPAPVDADTLANANELLADLPVDTIPNLGLLPAGSQISFSPNPLFVGRKPVLTRLAALLKGDGMATSNQITVAVTGLGGVGKTQLVTEFAHRYGRYFAGGVYWISFADPGAVLTQLASYGGPGAMDLRPDFAALPLEDRIRLVMSAWQSVLPRLLVFDNCEEEELLVRWRPPSGGARVLVTSRRESWDPTTNVTTVALGTLDRTESIELLRKYHPKLSADAHGLALTASELGDLPLALHLAGSFLARYRSVVTPTRYAHDLRRPDLVAHRSLEGSGISPTGHVQSIARTFTLSYERLDPADKIDVLAVAALARAARFAAGEQIPRPLLVATLGVDEDDVDDALDAEDALTRLVDLGLLEVLSDSLLRIHRLVAAFVRGLGEDVDAQLAVETTVLAAYQQLREEHQLLYASRLEPHLRAATDASLSRGDGQTARLCNVFGNHLRDVGHYADACVYLKRGLDIEEALAGKGHPSTARALNDLGFALYRADRPDEAVEYLERALPLWVQYGEEENLAATLDNLGQVMRNKDLKQGQAYFERALNIRQQLLGLSHPRTGVTLHNLGTTALRRGNLSEAERYIRMALLAKGSLREPSTAVSNSQLGLVLVIKGDRDDARAHYLAAAEIYGQTLGEDNPSAVRAALAAASLDPKFDQSELNLLIDRAMQSTQPSDPVDTTMLNNIGYLWWQDGDDAKAALLYKAALTIEESRLPPSSPRLSTMLNNLGMVAQRQSDYCTALRYYERALANQQTPAGGDPLLLARILNNMGALLLLLRDLVGAQRFLDEAWSARVRLLGENHGDSAITLQNLALFAQAKGDTDSARRQMEQALSISTETLGANHPQVARIQRELGMLLLAVGDALSAKVLLEQALTVQQNSLAPDHPDFATTLEDLATLAEDQSRHTDATSYLRQAEGICEYRFGPKHPKTKVVRERLAAIDMPLDRT